MHYKETIIELVGKIQSEKVLKRIYKFCTPTRLAVEKDCQSFLLSALKEM